MANRIPPELFENIIQHLCRYRDPYGRREVPLLTNRELGSCSLVSRYWAEKIRPFLFHNPAVHTRADAMSLLEFLQPRESATIANISKYVEVIHIVHDLTVEQPPCTHLLLCHGARMLPATYREARVILEIQGQAARRHHADLDLDLSVLPRSIYDGLPRALPPRSLEIHYFKLTRLRLPRFEEIIPLLRSSRPSHVACRSVYWSHCDWTTAHAVLFNARDGIWDRRSSNWCADIEDCTSAAPFVGLFITSHRRAHLPISPGRRSLVYISATELPLLISLLFCISELVSRPKPLGNRISTSDVSSDPDVRWRLRMSMNSELYRASVSLDVSSDGPVRSIDLHFLRPSAEHGVTYARPTSFPCDWAAIDAEASKLGATMRYLRIVLQNDSHATHADLEAFARYVSDRMPLLESGGRLRFAYFNDRKISRLVVLSPASGDVGPVTNDEISAVGEPGVLEGYGEHDA